MGTISVNLPEDNTTADVSDINDPINTIVTAINGNLDNDNIKASAGIDGSKLADATVTASKLSSGAITLGYAQITSDFTTSSSNAAVTGLSVTVTIPSGGRRIKITVWADNVQHTNAVTNVPITIWDGTVGSGTQLARSLVTTSGSNYASATIVMAVVTPSAGSKTYNVGFGSGSATSKIVASATSPAFILVEAI